MRAITIFIFSFILPLLTVAQQFRTISPSTFVQGKSYPFATESYNSEGVNPFYSVAILANGTGGSVPNNLIKIRKGRAMSTITTDGSSSLSLSTTQFTLNPNLNQSAVETHAGDLNGNQTWVENSIHRIASDLSISAGDTLTIEPGCWILLDSAVNVSVEGHISAQGIENNAIAFSANSVSAWGGIVFGNGTANFQHTLFHLAGGDFSSNFGHSGSQPVIRSNGGEVSMNHCFIFDCVGKALAGYNGRLIFKNGGISRCDTGGEFGGSYITIKATHVMEIPDDDGVLEDDDNDGFYFSGANATSEPNLVDSCFFLIGEDDGIDHNGAILEVKNTWIEGFANEGIAASNENSVYVYNTLFKDNEQGIEAGYGFPTVTVDHCVMIGNEYGLRFGDWYDWGCNGTITCTNSIMVDNDDNVHNFDFATNGPIANAINLTYSIPTDAEYDMNTGNVVGTPNFTFDYQLEAGSAGVGAASDGSNMGLVRPIISNVSNVAVEAGMFETFTVYSLDGKLIYRGESPSRLESIQTSLNNGIYVIEKVFENAKTHQKIAVFK